MATVFFRKQRPELVRFARGGIGGTTGDKKILTPSSGVDDSGSSPSFPSRPPGYSKSNCSGL